MLASPRRMRRLGDRELAEVASDILGTPVTVGADLIGDPQVDGWETDAHAFVVSGPKLDGCRSSRASHPRSRTGLLAVRSCAHCAARFARSTATRAFGRPPTARSSSSARRLRHRRHNRNADAGFRLVAEAILLAPSTLYRSEVGGAAAGAGGMAAGGMAAGGMAAEVKLTDYELASQLSFLFSGSRPDDVLLAAAERGELSNPKNAVAQATRLLAMPRARVQVEHMIEGRLRARQARHHATQQGVSRDDARRTDRDARRAASFHRPRRLRRQRDARRAARVEHVVSLRRAHADLRRRSPRGAQRRRRRTARSPASTRPALAPGVPHRPRLVRRDESGRSWPLRADAPPLPGNRRAAAVAFTMPVVAGADDGTTTRQKFEQHSTDPLCKGCHSQMDPIGFGLEGFDAIGRFRTLEHGLPVDDSGYLTDADVTGPFRGPAQLADLVLEERGRAYVLRRAGDALRGGLEPRRAVRGATAEGPVHDQRSPHHRSPPRLCRAPRVLRPPDDAMKHPLTMSRRAWLSLAGASLLLRPRRRQRTHCTRR